MRDITLNSSMKAATISLSRETKVNHDVQVNAFRSRVFLSVLFTSLLCPALRSQDTTGPTPPKSTSNGPASPTGYHVIGRYPIDGEGGWDYISIDSDARRLYVSHGTQLEVLDADSGKMVGKIAETPGV